MRPGARVEADTILMELSNPDLMRQAEEARYGLEIAKATFAEFELNLRSKELDQKAAVAQARAQYESARLQAEAERASAVIAELQVRKSELTAESLKAAYDIQVERLNHAGVNTGAELAASGAAAGGITAAVLERLRHQARLQTHFRTRGEHRYELLAPTDDNGFRLLPAPSPGDVFFDTNALKKVIEGQAKKVYFVQGHGERDPTDSNVEGFSGIADGLRSDNFEVEKITLIQAGKVPDDATVLVVAGPKTDLLEPEVKAIRDYLDRQGKLMLLLDPPDAADGPQPTSLIALARDYGIDVGANVVIDASGLGQLIGTNESTPVGIPAPHAITDRFQFITAFPFARSVKPIDGGTNGRTAQKVMETSPQSWAETDLKRLFASGETERNPDAGDLAGPVPIAAAVTVAGQTPEPPPAAETAPPAPRPEARLLVVGDSDFASNRVLGVPGNRDLYLNMANWLAQQEDLIAIRPKDPSNRGITLTADQQARINWIAFLGIPVLLIGNAVRVWWKRR